VRNVFWRILLFYILSILIVGLNVPYTHKGLSNGDTRTSPFTIVFEEAGSAIAGSFINAVIMTSVISAANHALFAGSRLLYTLAVDGYAPRFFGSLNRFHVPWVAVLGTSVISGLCFGASYIGASKLWSWLQKYAPLFLLLSFLYVILTYAASSASPTNSLGSVSASLPSAFGPLFTSKAWNISSLSRIGHIPTALLSLSA
jgi:AAT family amino acid transporter